MTELLSSKHASKAPSRFGKDPDEDFDVKVTHSEDIDGNSDTNDDGGHVGVGTSRDCTEPSGGQSVQLEQEKLMQRVDRMNESQTPVQKFGIIRSSIVEVEKVDIPRPAAEVENVDVPIVELEKVIPVVVAEVEKAPEVTVPIAQVEKVAKVHVPAAQFEKAVEVIMPAAHDEKTTNIPAQVNGMVVSEVEVDSEKVVVGVIT
ncbi:hypothetical protein K7X08_000009 [Anisodus acutangulus]|uniref:Uncharacterized protein n=1 Tax=Anisodus acutangulus TaxID=402998 RepID=A0A9Q1LKZ2_9SOLA|nr:hypothetical protein K7X08_000009 [Anisodus acutangulus]